MFIHRGLLGTGAVGIDTSGNPFQRLFRVRQTPRPNARGQTPALPGALAALSSAR
jgi:hypothetical protein